MIADLNIENDRHVAGAKNAVKCPECRQFHLTPNYCQARNPAATDMIARQMRGERFTKSQRLRAASGVTDSQLVTDSVEGVTDKPVTSDGVCVVCGGAFEKRRSDARYCSTGCRVKAHRGS